MADREAPNYNADEISILKQSRLFQDLTATETWKSYAAILEAQIRERERILLLPMQELPEKWQAMDFQTRMMGMEAIKGAVIGLKLARDLPSLTMAQAQEIVSEHKEDAGE